MTKKQFSKYTPRENGTRSLDEAIAEIQREMDVRKRLFDRWVAESKMSWMDAHDRMERHMSALKHLIEFAQQQAKAEQEQINPTISPVSFTPEDELDRVPDAATA